MASGGSSCGFVPLAPKPQEPKDTLQDSEQSTMSLEKVVRKPKTSTKSAEEWNAKRMLIHDLYIIHDLPLLEVMQIMENKHCFSQSYVVPLCAWRSAGPSDLQIVADAGSILRSSKNGDMKRTSKRLT